MSCAQGHSQASLYKEFTLAAFPAQLAISVIKDPVNLDLFPILNEIEGWGLYCPV